MTKETEVAVYLGRNNDTKDTPYMQAEGNEVLMGGRTTDEEEGHWLSLKYEGDGKFVVSPLDDETNIELKQVLTPEQIKRKVQRIESPDLSQVKPGRTKKDPLTVTNFIDSKNTIKLKITATPENWKKIKQLLSENSAEFAADFYHKFIDIALYKVILPKKARGRSKDAATLVRELKYHSGNLYQFLSYWSKKPKEEWPNYLKRLIETIEKKGNTIDILRSRDIIVSREGKISPKKLTLYIMEELYTKTAEKCGLRPFDDPNNFYIKYIYGSGILRYDKRDSTRYIDLPPEIVARLGFFIPPLQKILRIFKLN